MNRIERFYKIDPMLHARGVVSLDGFLTELEVSRATFRRDMEYLRDRLHAPIVWDRSARGYRFDGSHALGPVYELPGLWFSASELYALLTAHKLLADIEPGVLALHLAPLQNRLQTLLEASGHTSDEISQRVRLLSMTKRTLEPRHFAEVARALLERKRLEVVAWSRGRDEVNTRIIAPQRLVHYRDNWYLDAWCHWRSQVRAKRSRSARCGWRSAATGCARPALDRAAPLAGRRFPVPPGRNGVVHAANGHVAGLGA
ncbi:MAG: WYL domain-containing protein [Rhodoferax sp.]|uniref:helix-turn-helix transcriptional regulator n=1 Tax=Rhodoferax sp. TaxID=50421 RepID=UPI002735466A|nr:WYL domain-containing protein [Rhodoferax sp.]MDP2680136.1 WYL domain-containing protein [Rhodoferax sp.]